MLTRSLAGLTIGLQVLYPLLRGSARDLLTVLTVLAFLATTLCHARGSRGRAWTLHYLLVAAGVSFAAEAVGVATGAPFGEYAYADSLGPALLGVPVLVPLAWAMFAYPCLLAGTALGHPVVLGAAALASWDLFLDPQMVAAGHWRWLDVEHAVPGLGPVPWSNVLGWLAVSLLLMALLSRLPVVVADDRVPAGLLLWTWASSVLANLAFFGRPGVALVGGLAMGAVVLPAVRRMA